MISLTVLKDTIAFALVVSGFLVIAEPHRYAVWFPSIWVQVVGFSLFIAGLLVTKIRVKRS